MEQRVCDGRYEIQRKLGEGSQAEVFAGLDRQLMRQVAVKVYRKREGDEQNLAKEAQLLKELQHPMLPALYDVSEEGCLIMEYLGGGNLREYVERNGALDEKKAGELALALLHCLCYIHGRTPMILYGDLKPDNVMLDGCGKWRLTDWGAAARRSYDGTGIGRMGATAGYAAPEISGEDDGASGLPGPASDLYSLGRVLYYAVTGADPALPPYGKLPARCYNPMLSRNFEKVLEKAVRVEVQERFQTAQEMQEELEKCRKNGWRTNRETRRKTGKFLYKIEKSVWLAQEKGECTFYKDSCIILQ